MLTTIGLILAAYLIQDYFIAWSKRRRAYYRAKKGGIRQNLFIISLVSLGIICGIAVSLAEPNQKPGIKAFLGTVYAGTRTAQIDRLSDFFQRNGQKSESKPAYVFLNPGMPSNLLKLPNIRRLRKPQRLHNAITVKRSLSKPQHHHDFNNKIYAKN
jgi:hypothetical protein